MKEKNDETAETINGDPENFVIFNLEHIADEGQENGESEEDAKSEDDYFNEIHWKDITQKS